MKLVKPIGRDTMEYWAFVAQLVSAFAVVVSLVYVAVQVGESTKLLRSQAHYNALTIGQDLFTLTVADQALADLMSTCYSQPEALPPGQWIRCSQYLLIMFNAYEYHFYQHRDRAIPKELWVGADSYFKGYIATPAFRRFWRDYRGAFDDPFRTHVENELTRTAPKPAAAQTPAAAPPASPTEKTTEP